jgi:hypothetical protein
VVIDGSAWLYSLCRNVATAVNEPSTYQELRGQARRRIRKYCLHYFDKVAFVFDGLYESRKRQEHLERSIGKNEIVKKWYTGLVNWSEGVW